MKRFKFHAVECVLWIGVAVIGIGGALIALSPALLMLSVAWCLVHGGCLK